MHVAWDGFGQEAGERNLLFFRVKWLQPAMKGTAWASPIDSNQYSQTKINDFY